MEDGRDSALAPGLVPRRDNQHPPSLASLEQLSLVKRVRARRASVGADMGDFLVAEARGDQDEDDEQAASSAPRAPACSAFARQRRRSCVESTVRLKHLMDGISMADHVNSHNLEGADADARREQELEEQETLRAKERLTFLANWTAAADALAVQTASAVVIQRCFRKWRDEAHSGRASGKSGRGAKTSENRKKKMLSNRGLSTNPLLGKTGVVDPLASALAFLSRVEGEEEASARASALALAAAPVGALLEDVSETCSRLVTSEKRLSPARPDLSHASQAEQNTNMGSEHALQQTGSALVADAFPDDGKGGLASENTTDAWIFAVRPAAPALVAGESTLPLNDNEEEAVAFQESQESSDDVTVTEGAAPSPISAAGQVNIAAAFHAESPTHPASAFSQEDASGNGAASLWRSGAPLRGAVSSPIISALLAAQARPWTVDETTALTDPQDPFPDPVPELPSAVAEPGPPPSRIRRAKVVPSVLSMLAAATAAVSAAQFSVSDVTAGTGATKDSLSAQEPQPPPARNGGEKKPGFFMTAMDWTSKVLSGSSSKTRDSSPAPTSGHKQLYASPPTSPQQPNGSSSFASLLRSSAGLGAKSNRRHSFANETLGPSSFQRQPPSFSSKSAFRMSADIARTLETVPSHPRSPLAARSAHRSGARPSDVASTSTDVLAGKPRSKGWIGRRHSAVEPWDTPEDAATSPTNSVSMPRMSNAEASRVARAACAGKSRMQAAPAGSGESKASPTACRDTPGLKDLSRFDKRDITAARLNDSSAEDLQQLNQGIAEHAARAAQAAESGGWMSKAASAIKMNLKVHQNAVVASETSVATAASSTGTSGHNSLRTLDDASPAYSRIVSWVLTQPPSAAGKAPAPVQAWAQPSSPFKGASCPLAKCAHPPVGGYCASALLPTILSNDQERPCLELEAASPGTPRKSTSRLLPNIISSDVEEASTSNSSPRMSSGRRPQNVSKFAGAATEFSTSRTGHQRETMG